MFLIVGCVDASDNIFPECFENDYRHLSINVRIIEEDFDRYCASCYFKMPELHEHRVPMDRSCFFHCRTRFLHQDTSASSRKESRNRKDLLSAIHSVPPVLHGCSLYHDIRYIKHDTQTVSLLHQNYR